MGSEAVDLILQQKPSRALLAISREGGTYASMISREIESTFAHTTRILGKLEEQGLIKFEPDGSDNRVKRVELTALGENAAALLEELVGVLENKSQPRKRRTSRKTSENMAEKLEMIRSSIEQISKDELEGKAGISQEDFVRIGRRLGPYRRELKRIMEVGSKRDVERSRVLDMMIEDIFKERTRLMDACNTPLNCN